MCVIKLATTFDLSESNEGETRVEINVLRTDKYSDMKQYNFNYRKNLYIIERRLQRWKAAIHKQKSKAKIQHKMQSKYNRKV